MSEVASRSKFSGKLGFIVAASGSAVGIGNLMRFPYLADKYGGGAFLIVYLILALLFGFALMVTEIAIGRKTGKSCIEAFYSFGKKHRWIGYLCIIAPILIAGYISVVGGWSMRYATVFAFDMDLMTADFFANFTSFSIGGIINNPLFWFVIFIGICIFICCFKVEKGIEVVGKVLMPLLFILLIIMFVSILTIGGIWDGMINFLTPKADSINSGTFLGALGQLFFSLSLGQGVMITFGSYLDNETDIKSSTLIVESMDILVSVISSLIIVPAVYVFGTGMENGYELMFKALPLIFEKMEFGQVFGILFFVLVAFAILTSTIALIEVPVSALIDKFNIHRTKCAAIVLIVTIIIGAVCCLGYGPLSSITINDSNILVFVDTVAGNFMLPIIELGICILVGYFVGTEVILDVTNIKKESFLGKMYRPVMRYVAPVFITIILIAGILNFFHLYSL